MKKSIFFSFFSIFLHFLLYGLYPGFNHLLHFYDGLYILSVMLMDYVSLPVVLCDVFLAVIHTLLLNGVRVITGHTSHIDITLNTSPEYVDHHSFLMVDSGHWFLYLEITM